MGTAAKPPTGTDMPNPNRATFVNDELRQLATAIKALAESNQGIGGVVREQVASQNETNRVLGLIHDQNAEILKHMETFSVRQRDSERHLRVVQSSLKEHGERLERVEAALGIADAE